MPETGFYSLPTGKLHKKPKQSRLKNFPAGYVGSFYRNLADNVDNFLGSDFYGRISNDVNIPSEDIQKYILATSDFAKGMQNDINHYVAPENPIIGSLLRELDVKIKVLANGVIKGVPTPPSRDYEIHRLNRLKDRQEPKNNNNNNLSPPPSPPFFPPSCTVHTASTSAISTPTIGF